MPGKTSKIDHFWTMAELAEQLGVSRQRAHFLVKRYGVPSLKVHPSLTLIHRRDAIKLVKMDRPTGRRRNTKSRPDGRG